MFYIQFFIDTLSQSYKLFLILKKKQDWREVKWFDLFSGSWNSQQNVSHALTVSATSRQAAPETYSRTSRAGAPGARLPQQNHRCGARAGRAARRGCTHITQVQTHTFRQHKRGHRLGHWT